LSGENGMETKLLWMQGVDQAYSQILPNRQIYSKFVKAVVMKPYLDYLSSDNHGSKLKTLFLELFLDEVEKRSKKSKMLWFLDFVRLNIIAYRP
jgi:hypothetical protein